MKRNKKNVSNLWFFFLNVCTVLVKMTLKKKRMHASIFINCYASKKLSVIKSTTFLVYWFFLKIMPWNKNAVGWHLNIDQFCQIFACSFGGFILWYLPWNSKKEFWMNHLLLSPVSKIGWFFLCKFQLFSRNFKSFHIIHKHTHNNCL
jgi:hypothetical protein